MNNIKASAKYRDPFLRVVKRNDLSKNKIYTIRFLALILALVTGGLFILILGRNPFAAYFSIIKGSVGTGMSFQETIKVTIPLLIASLGVTLAFKMKFWNIGGEGQICAGAIAASYFALFHSNWPHVTLIIVMFIAGFVAGGLWGLIPAVFKANFGTNETLFTLMLNYVAIYFIQFLREGPWKSPENMGFPQIATFSDNAVLPQVFGVHIGWIVALVLVVFVYYYINHTKSGYELRVVGESEATAAYAGMNVKKIIIRTMFLSGAICGLVGMLQVSGTDMTLTEEVSGGVGFTAIIISWLAQLNPFGMLIVSFLFGVLEKGCGTAQSLFNISPYASDVLEGIILFFVLGCEFFTRYKLVARKRGDK